jgi:hypothetical protein
MMTRLMLGVVALLAITTTAGCGDSNGPKLIEAPGPAAGGQVHITITHFFHNRESACRALGRAIVPRATYLPPGFTGTAADENKLTKTVRGYVQPAWLNSPTTLLIHCTWLSNGAADLKGLYVIRRGVGLRAGGTYIGTAVMDRAGRWTPDETSYADGYE